jgi:hypothetical protein
MAFISFSCQQSYFYFLIFWIIDVLISIYLILIDKIYYYSLENMIKNEIIINLKTISDLCAGFLVLSTYIRMKKVNQKEEQKIIEKIKNRLSRRYKYFYIFLISFLEFICRSTDFFYLITLGNIPIRKEQLTWLIPVDIIARIVLSRRVLKLSLFRHHYFSLVLVILGFLSMSICEFQTINEIDLNNWPYFIFIIIRNILLPLEDVYNKILLTDKFLLPHYLMFWRGLFNCVFLALLCLCFFLTRVIKYEFNIPNEMNSAIYLLHKIILIILYFCRAFIYLKIIDVFSPQHVAFCNTALYLYLFLLWKKKSGDNFYLSFLDYFSLILIIFATLIFNEILIINACGLNQNTKKGFIKKEILELQSINSLDNHEDEEDSEENEDKEENIDSKRETLNRNDISQSNINENIDDFDGNTNNSINNTEMGNNDNNNTIIITN